MPSPVRRSTSRQSSRRPSSRSSTRSRNTFRKDNDQQSPPVSTSSPYPSCAEHVPGSASSPSMHHPPSDGEGDGVQDPSPPSPAHPHVPKQTRFGLHVPTNQPRVIGNFDFEEKYPEDPIYEELGPNARVWRANLDECEVYDNEMVTEAGDGLDLLLVFAGLFSAVLTTFVTQTSQALSNNLPAVSTSLLLEMVKLQRAIINGTSIDNVPVSELTIIGILPIVLHVALGLFLAGLVIFLIPLNVPLAIIIGLITLVIYSMYAIQYPPHPIHAMSLSHTLLRHLECYAASPGGLPFINR